MLFQHEIGKQQELLQITNLLLCISLSNQVNMCARQSIYLLWRAISMELAKLSAIQMLFISSAF